MFLDCIIDTHTSSRFFTIRKAQQLQFESVATAARDLVDGNTFTVVARGGNSKAQGMDVRDRSMVEIGTGYTFDVRERNVSPQRRMNLKRSCSLATSE
jgi:hypothetical protein